MAVVPPPPAPRQLLLMCDGTNSNLTGGHADTNVVKLSELVAADPDPDRIVCYDPGVGNSGELPGATGWDRLRRGVDRLNGLAFGRGVYENMAECYLFLMRHYRPGDQIYIVGFSRGAFTARSVAGLVNLFGILSPQLEGMVPTLMHIYFSGRPDEAARAKLDAVSQQVTRQFVDASRQPDIEFVGVWDTVASVGVAPFGARFTALPTPQHKAFVHIRQALALDEHRSQFKPRLYAADNGSFVTRSGRSGSLDQRWFPGSHCDVGGGFAVGESALSDRAFAWLVSQAVQCGLRLRAAGVPLDTEAAVQARLAQVHAPIAADRPLRVHSQLRDTAAWAITGMVVRDTRRVVMDGGASVAVRPEEHPGNDGLALTVATNGSWAGARTPWLVWPVLVLMPVCVLWLGWLLHPGACAGASGPAASDLLRYVQANLAFQHWQLTGWLNPDWLAAVKAAPGSLGSWFATDVASLTAQPACMPRWALFWDLALVGFYAGLLSWFAALSFARIAGLRRAGQPVPRGLNLLGLALPVMVFADIAENLFTWASLTAAHQDFVVLALLCHLVAAACTAAKLLGLAGTGMLIAVGMLRPDQRHAGT